MADKKEEKIKATSPVMAGPSNTSKTEERPKVAPAVVPSPLQSPSVAPATQWMGTSENIEVDPKMLDSDYDSNGYDTSTASLASSLNEYIFENGRRYHAYFGASKNPLPTDELEQDRLDLHHEIMLQLMNGEIHLSPLKDPQRILDIGTGTGIWAIDAADRYPMAEVIGTDLSPIQPEWVPPNCRFEVDDAELEWTFEPELFDFIHLRNIAQGIGDWPKLMAEVYRCTKPGGYVELAEVSLPRHTDDGTAEGGAALVWCDRMAEAMAKINRPFPSSVKGLTEKLEKAGFVDIVHRLYKQPVGLWPKEKKFKNIGGMALMTCDSGFEAYGLQVFTKILGMSTDEATKVCRNALEDVRKKTTHLYCCFYVAYGRKPTKAEY